MLGVERESYARVVRGIRLILCALSVVLTWGCGSEQTAPEETAELAQALEPIPATLTIALPDRMTPHSTPLVATNSLRIADRAKIKKKRGGYAPVVNLGTAYTQIGVEAISGNVWTNAPATLADRSRVEGFVRGASTVGVGNAVVVTGGVQSNISMGPLRESTWAPVVPASTGGNVHLEPQETRTIAPGGYGSVSVKQGATLTLSTGTYAFEGGVMLEPGSKLLIDDDAGPVIVYVRGSGITHRGAIQKKGDPASTKIELLFITLDAGGSFVEAPFRGTIFAPKGALTLQPLNGTGEHFGAFLGKDVNVEAGVVINHRAFPWSAILPPGTIEMKDSPVSLKPIADGPGGATGEAETSTPSPVTFEIPRDIWVAIGNAGHGTLEFSFRSPNGITTVCTYIGGSPVAAPVTDLDRAKGLRYTFPSCTNGYQYGQTATADWFKAEIISDATNAPKTTVALNLGGGCSGSLPAHMAPEEVVAMRDNFNWRTVAALPELDSEGRRALWHGVIYVDRPEQLQALDRWRVYWSAMPISENYTQQLQGKCGRVEHATDGKGLVVYAIFPAKLFNIVRASSIEAALANVEPPFKFIIPSTPDQPAYVNPDGSIKHSALASAGFAEWLALRAQQQPWFVEDALNWVAEGTGDLSNWIDDNIIDPAGEGVEDGFSYVVDGWDEFVDWAATALDDGWESIQSGFGDFVGIFEDEINVRLHVQMLNRDPLFPSGSRVTRAWGPSNPDGSRPFILPEGVFVSIRQWGWGFVPILNQEKLPADGDVVIEVIEDAEGRGGNGLCFELGNDDAIMTTDFAPNEVCNFDGPVFDDFEHETENYLITSQKDLYSLTQIVDSADYVRTVIGWEPHRMDILIGGLANTMTALINDLEGSLSATREGESRAMCLCLDFPSVGAAGITTIGAALSGAIENPAALLASSALLKDLWWPDDVDAPVDSRGVMTHEYGHFTMCSLLFDKAAGDSGLSGPSALTPLIGRIFEGQNDSRSDTIALITESWADTFAMQVVGGSNYLTTHNATNPDFDYRMGICTAPYCMEWNYRGANDYPFEGEFDDELARVESTIHDAFDRADSTHRLTYQPWNGDVWTMSASGLLQFSPTPYLAANDEPASLTGVGWQFWVEHWLARGGSVDFHDYLGGLADAMAQQGNSWCDRCEVFAVHEFAGTDTFGNPTGDPSSYVATTFGQHYARWQICAGDGDLQGILGGPPEAYLNLRADCSACGPLEFSNNGVCTACPPGQVPRGDHCDACLNGMVPGPNNECVSCAANEISVGSACQPCPFGTAADHFTNLCLPCPPSAVVDLSTVPLDGCSANAPLTTTVPPPASFCPSFVEVRNLDALIAAGCSGVILDVQPTGTLNALTCPNRVANGSVWDSSWTLLDSGGAVGLWDPGTCPPPSPTTPVCLDPPRCEFGVSFTVDAAAITGGLDTVRLIARAQDVTGQPSDIPAQALVQLLGGVAPP